MSFAQELEDHYRQVRARLINPPNAVPDTGINLHRKPEPETTEEQPPIPEPEAPDFPAFVPFRRTDLTFSSTLTFTAREFNISPKEIRTHTRLHAVALPRQVAVWIAHKLKIQTFAGMGRYLGMDHTSMLHGQRKIDKLIHSDDALRQHVSSVEEKLLAAYPRFTVPALSEPLLGCQKEQENGHKRSNEVATISPVDSFGRPAFHDSEEEARQPDVVGELPMPTRASCP